MSGTGAAIVGYRYSDATGAAREGQVSIAATATADWIYLAAHGAGEIKRCLREVSGDLTGCTTVLDGVNRPVGITVAGRTLYVAESGMSVGRSSAPPTSARYCHIADDGTLTDCGSAADGTASPMGVAVQGNRLWISSMGTQRLVGCDLDANGVPSNCTPSFDIGQAPHGLTAAADGSLYVGVTNPTSGYLRCTMAGDGSLDTCAAVGLLARRY